MPSHLSCNFYSLYIYFVHSVCSTDGFLNNIYIYTYIYIYYFFFCKTFTSNHNYSCYDKWSKIKWINSVVYIASPGRCSEVREKLWISWTDDIEVIIQLGGVTAEPVAKTFLWRRLCESMKIWDTLSGFQCLSSISYICMYECVTKHLSLSFRWVSYDHVWHHG